MEVRTGLWGLAEQVVWTVAHRGPLRQAGQPTSKELRMDQLALAVQH